MGRFWGKEIGPKKLGSPATGSPCSLINLQVSVGGVDQLQSTHDHNFEKFIEQVSQAEQLTSSDFGVTYNIFN